MPKISSFWDWQIKSQEIRTGILGFESYDDVPEEDDMTFIINVDLCPCKNNQPGNKEQKLI